MTLTHYSYLVIRYVHDPASGEGLNVGVALLAADGIAEIRLETRYERLSRSFRGFDPETYKRVLRSLEKSFRDLGRDVARPMPFDKPSTVSLFLRAAWPLVDGMFEVSGERSGLTPDLEVEAHRLFERYVTSQAPTLTVETRRDDEAVWRESYSRRLPASVVRALRPQRFETPSVDVTFEHAYKNAQWHAIQPISFDYAKDDRIQAKAQRWLGIATGLEDARDFGTLYFLLGEPSDRSHLRAYEKAKNLLHKAPVSHQFVTEGQAADFGKRLEDEMRAHGVIEDEEPS